MCCSVRRTRLGSSSSTSVSPCRCRSRTTAPSSLITGYTMASAQRATRHPRSLRHAAATRRRQSTRGLWASHSSRCSLASSPSTRPMAQTGATRSSRRESEATPPHATCSSPRTSELAPSQRRASSCSMACSAPTPRLVSPSAPPPSTSGARRRRWPSTRSRAQTLTALRSSTARAMTSATVWTRRSRRRSSCPTRPYASLGRWLDSTMTVESARSFQAIRLISLERAGQGPAQGEGKQSALLIQLLNPKNRYSYYHRLVLKW
mmetsp:Transcript_24344/g.56597  ORF Transcript_24344/g.56597 Transcript_24344/m.56597 type:complete len:263 (+) Transcript_24344:541-1329(+)